MKRYIILNALIVMGVLFMAPGCNSSEKTEHNEEVHDSEDVHDGMIELSEKQMNTVGIELGTFSTMALGESVHASGELKVDVSNTADVTPVMNGIIKNIAVREGDYVKAGEVVAVIENLEINNLIREYKSSVSNLKLAENEYDRQKKLASHGAGIAKNLDRAAIECDAARSLVESYKSQIKMAGINLGQIDSDNRAVATVKSPISGVVTKIYGKIGSEVGTSQPVLSVTDNSGIYAMVRIFEKDLDKIKRGMLVEVSLTNAPGIMRGKVDDIIRSIDPESRTIDVRVGILGADKGSLIPGMGITAYINTEEVEVPVLPEDAVVSMEGKEYIFMLAEKEIHEGETSFVFKPIEVVKGNARNGFVEVTPVVDLPKDALIVTSKAFYISSKASDHGEHNH